MAELEEVHENADDWWRSSAEQALSWLARDGQPFSAFDITELGVPDPDDSHRWGALFRAAYTRGQIEPVGYEQSRRPSRAGGVCRVWRGVQQESRAA